MLALALIGAMAVAAAIGIAAHFRAPLATTMKDRTMSKMRHVAAMALAWTATPGATQAPPTALPAAPPTRLGINLAPFSIYATTAPFANLAISDSWSVDGKPLTDQQVDKDGNLLSLPPGSRARHYILVPPTGPEGFDAICTFTGAGTLTIGDNATPGIAGSHSLKVHLTNVRGLQGRPWLELSGFDPKHPLRDLDCRDAKLGRDVRFRPEALRPLRGFGTVRFMDWQHANDNLPTRWADRHLPGSLRVDRDGIAIEDMMAMANAVGADPWFVMPWNADDDYITRFAQLVRTLLPPGRSVYVETGNEVWNGAFAVAKQAIAEGMARHLSTDPNEAGMRRYAQRTVEVMRLWEAAFAGHPGLVRVLATFHDLPSTAETALAFADTKDHVDALATAPYFGSGMPGSSNTRDAAFAKMEGELAHAIDLMTLNRRVAARYGKRYVTYEGGPSLVLPEQKELAEKIQHDEGMYDLVGRFLAAWASRSGDVLCLYDSIEYPNPWWTGGLAETEIDTPAQAPKLRAAHDFIAGHTNPPAPSASPIARRPAPR